MEYRSIHAMNTEVVMAAEGDAASIETGFQAAQRSIVENEQRFTRFSTESELSQLNRSAGSWFSASPALFGVIQLALHYSQSTGGLFDISVLEALKKAGYDRSMDLILEKISPKVPPSEITYQPAVQDPDRYGFMDRKRQVARLDPEHSSIWLPPGMSLDLGGIAKGWIVEQAARQLRRFVDACAVNAGGDMLLVGLPDGETAWEIDLEDPRDPEGSLGVLRVNSGAVATSSVMKRRWRQGDKLQHHLIDPRTGEPAESPWLSVTVFAPGAVEAEVLAKSILIAGPRLAGSLIAAHPQSAFLAVDRSGTLLGSQNFEERFHVI